MIRRSGQDDAQAFHEAWESRSPRTHEVRDLVRAAEALCESAVAEPRAEFRSALRERLMTEAQTVLVPAPGASRPNAATPRRTAPVAPSRARRRIAGVAAAAVSSLGVVGLVAGSAQAGPGDMLYPVKRGVENVELALQRTEESRGTQRLEIASERLREARAEIGEGDSTRVASLLDDFTTQAERGSTELFSSYDADGSATTIETINDFAAASAVDLSIMSADVPDEAGGAFEAAAAVVTDVAGQASRMCGACEQADVDALVRTVTQVVGERGTTRDETTPASSSTASTPKKASPTASPSATTAPPVVAVPVLPAPSSSPSSKGLRSLTDPVVGSVLGDEENEGLVPGLLNGLLGNAKK